jgi:thiamine biosynthesis lipoprotein
VSAGVVARDFEALGTTCSLFGIGLKPERLERGEAWVRSLHARLTRFQPDSELSRLNAAAGTWFPVSDELEELLRESLRAWELSGGLVNVAVLPAMHGIGYERPLSMGTPVGVEVGAPVAVRPLPDLLEVVPGRARLEPGAGVDLGGLAKGWMADRLTERLGDNALANLGGDLCARGLGPAGEGWPVDFAGVTVLLREQGAATSSTRKRAWQMGVQRVHHLIDPRTGAPARSDLTQVSVVATTAVRAEVFAKAALLLGSAAAPPLLAANCQAWWLG